MGDSRPEDASNGPSQAPNPGIISGMTGQQSEDGDAFVRRMMRERGISDGMQQLEDNSPMQKLDSISEKDNKGRQMSPDDIGAHLHYETGEE